MIVHLQGQSAQGEVVPDIEALLTLFDQFLSKNEPTGIFRVERNEKDYLEMAVNYRGIFLSCTHGEDFFETLIPMHTDIGFTAEDFLVAFWEKTHIDQFNFEPLSDYGE